MNTKHIDINSLKHFCINLILAAVGGIEWGGVQAAAAASVTKEFFDKASYGHWCWWDILFDTLGAAIGEGIHYLIFKSL